MTTENPGAPAPAPVVAPAAAPVAAPVAAPAAAPTPAPEPKQEPAGEPTELALDEKDDGKGGFAETGDQGLDMALAFVHKNGFGPGHPAIVAAVKGDFSILRAELAGKNVPGAEAYMALAEKAYQKFHAENESKRAADKAAVHAIVGGEEQWQAITTWAKANAEPEEAAGINKALSAGGFEAKMAATFLAHHYNRATGGVAETDGAGPSAAASRGAAAVGLDVLSAREYGSAVIEARNKHNHREGPFENSKAYADLRDRRERGRKMGK